MHEHRGAARCWRDGRLAAIQAPPRIVRTKSCIGSLEDQPRARTEGGSPEEALADEGAKVCALVERQGGTGMSLPWGQRDELPQAMASGKRR